MKMTSYPHTFFEKSFDDKLQIDFAWPNSNKAKIMAKIFT